MSPSRRRRCASPAPHSNRYRSRSCSDSRHCRRTPSHSPPSSHHRRRTPSRSPPSSHHRRRTPSRSPPSSSHRRGSPTLSPPSSHHRGRSSYSSHRPGSPTRSPPSSRPPRRCPAFASHHDYPDLPPKIRRFCEILSYPSTPLHSLLSLLDDTRTSVTPSDVEAVLRLSYSHPGPALTFFRWAGERHLNHEHSANSWDIVVDMLGKNLHFDVMWETVRTMRDQKLLSLATFVSIFSILALNGRTGEAVAAFRALPMYGIQRDTVALNSLLAALCRAGLLGDGCAVLGDAEQVGVVPDMDSFAILLEGCQSKNDSKCAQKVLIEMIKTLG